MTSSSDSQNRYGSLKRPLLKDEDAPPFIWRSKDGRELILGVFDGMGGRGALAVNYQGHEKTMGWLASRLAAKAVSRFADEGDFSKEKLEHHLKIVFCDTGLPRPVTKIKIRDESIYPTTLAVVHIKLSLNSTTRVTYWWAGDSRVYLIQNSNLELLTVDHVFDHGVASSPLSKWISIKSQELSCGTRLIDGRFNVLICSDGVYSSLSKSQMKYIVNPTHQDQIMENLTHSDDMSLAWVTVTNDQFTYFPDKPYTSTPKSAVQELEELKDHLQSSERHSPPSYQATSPAPRRTRLGSLEASRDQRQPVSTRSSEALSGVSPHIHSFLREVSSPAHAPQATSPALGTTDSDLAHKFLIDRINKDLISKGHDELYIKNKNQSKDISLAFLILYHIYNKHTRPIDLIDVLKRDFSVLVSIKHLSILRFEFIFHATQHFCMNEGLFVYNQCKYSETEIDKISKMILTRS